MVFPFLSLSGRVTGALRCYNPLDCDARTLSAHGAQGVEVSESGLVPHVSVLSRFSGNYVMDQVYIMFRHAEVMWKRINDEVKKNCMKI